MARLRITLLAFLIAILAIAVMAQNARADRLSAPIIKLDAEVQVTEPSIRLGEIATFDGFDELVRDQLEALELGRAAPPGEVRVLPRDVIASALRRAGPEVLLDAPEQVRVTSAGIEIAPELVARRFERALRHRMPWPDESVTLDDLSLPEPFVVPLRAERMRVHFRPDERFVGRVSAELEWLDPRSAETASIRRTVSARLDVRIPIVVATRPLRRGESIGIDALALEPRELANTPPGVFQRVDAVLGQRLRHDLPAGRPLAFRDLDSPDLVRRGDTVRVEASTMGLDVRLDARALENGKLGQRIRAENPVSRRTLMIEVTGEGIARLALPRVGSAR